MPSNIDQDHPVFDVPAFHFHPCNTAAAMEDIGGGQGVGLGLENYLQTWVGLVGGHVGLTLPLSLPERRRYYAGHKEQFCD